MIGDKVEYNGTTYEIKKDISFGDYRKISKVSNSLLALSEKYADTKNFEEIDSTLQSKIVNEFTTTTDKQLDLIVEFLESSLGLKQKDIDSLALTDAVGLFNETFKTATTVKKKSEATSDSPYS